MNYFAHALPWLDQPYFLAGLAVPDWLSVVNRKCRVRPKSVNRATPELSTDGQQIAAGILQHLDDDRWFHGTPAFFEAVGVLGAEYRRILPEDAGWKCGFLGHITLEILIDAVLIDDHPHHLEAYYDVMESVDGELVEETVSQLSTVPAENLATFVELYRRERFLVDYLDNTQLLRRMNQVMRRVELELLPPDVSEVFDLGRDWIRPRLPDLLPVAVNDARRS
ncbi:MAG: hypothetical protein KDA58_00260 [Planctomycetaceae bacterium]|nr:hypothetical protein [Planctomycetaceae bacterium]MCA9078949.1 hypothetical protein [Planctomycetaceae bacterium]